MKAPTVFGCSSAVVLTGSMSGTVEPDDLIITHKQSDYTVGDIVMYQTGGTPVTHRIISENEKATAPRVIPTIPTTARIYRRRMWSGKWCW